MQGNCFENQGELLFMYTLYSADPWSKRSGTSHIECVLSTKTTARQYRIRHRGLVCCAMITSLQFSSLHLNSSAQAGCGLLLLLLLLRLGLGLGLGLTAALQRAPALVKG